VVPQSSEMGSMKSHTLPQIQMSSRGRPGVTTRDHRALANRTKLSLINNDTAMYDEQWTIKTSYSRQVTTRHNILFAKLFQNLKINYTIQKRQLE